MDIEQYECREIQATEEKLIKMLNEQSVNKPEVKKENEDIIGYIRALRYVAGLKKEDIIDEEKNKQIIKEKIQILYNFVEDYKEKYYQVSLIEGFLPYSDSIKGRNRFFYIADQKMKAAVYYVRYMNFLERNVIDFENTLKDDEKEIYSKLIDIKQKMENVQALKKITDFQSLNELYNIDNKSNIEKIDEMMSRIPDLKMVLMTVKHEADEKSGEVDEKKKVQEIISEIEDAADCYDKYLTTKKCKDVDYMKYLLFNNMMREMKYVGGAYKYLWHWKSDKKTLFRCGYYKYKEVNECNKNTKQGFLEQMFNDVIAHMNKPSENLRSYSEDPYLDIYKYLRIDKSRKSVEKEKFKEIYNEKGLIIKADIDNDNNTEFEIIKGTLINSVKRGGEKPEDFYSFVQDGEEIRNGEKLSYAVEMYADLGGDKTKKETTLNIKPRLYSYLRSWQSHEENVKEVGRYVGDDKEVIVYGNIEDEVVDFRENPEKIKDYSNCGETLCKIEDGHRYIIRINKDKFLNLLLKMGEADKKLEKKLSENAKNFELCDYLDGFDNTVIKSCLEGSIEKISCEGSVTCPKVKVYKKVKIDITIEMNNEYLKTIAPEVKNTLELKRIIMKDLQKRINVAFAKRYEDLVKCVYPEVKFILDIIKYEKYPFKDYIRLYKMYKSNEADSEIVMLKEIIFKE